MKAILIDSTARTVKEVQLVEGHTLEGMYKHLGVELVERAFELPNGDDCFVDEEGLMKDSQGFFMYKGAHQPFAGNGIIVGLNEDGETIAAKSNVDEVKSQITFYTLADMHRMFEGNQ
jgi:hypothetical protein